MQAKRRQARDSPQHPIRRAERRATRRARAQHNHPSHPRITQSITHAIQRPRRARDPPRPPFYRAPTTSRSRHSRLSRDSLRESSHALWRRQLARLTTLREHDVLVHASFDEIAHRVIHIARIDAYEPSPGIISGITNTCAPRAVVIVVRLLILVAAVGAPHRARLAVKAIATCACDVCVCAFGTRTVA
jgi:hypothetical protein